MARRHRMTPARRAALKKAQAASARKRRGRHIKGVGRAVGTGAVFVGGTFAAYHVNRYIVRPDHFVKESHAAGKAVGRGISGAKRKITGKKSMGYKESAQALRKAKDWSKFGYL